MKTSDIVKLNFLVLGFLLVIYAIYSLNKGGLPAGISELFSPQTSGSKKISWCETRVKSIIKPDAFQLEQQGMKWFSMNGGQRELDFITVEKWFGRNCAVRGELIPAINEADLASFKPVIFVKFIDEKVEALGRNEGGMYIWQGQAFHSADLDRALTELGELMGFASQD